MAMQRVNMYLTAQQVERLIRLEEKTGIKMSENVRRAIDKHLREEEKAVREQEASEKTDKGE